MPTGIEALEGKSALVLDRVARDAGQVKLDGQVWTARPFNDGDVYEPGESVTVMHIDGATAVVFKTLARCEDAAREELRCKVRLLVWCCWPSW